MWNKDISQMVAGEEEALDSICNHLVCSTSHLKALTVN